MKHLKCAICNLDFNHSTNKPLILNKCGHTFCLNCIEKKLNLEKKIICPEDKIIYSDYKISDFPINNLILNILKPEKNFSEKKKICKSHEKKLEYFCLEDKVFLKRKKFVLIVEFLENVKIIK